MLTWARYLARMTVLKTKLDRNSLLALGIFATYLVVPFIA